MSLYNMLMGRNPFAPYLLASIGITQQTADIYPLGRIRDVYTNDAGDKVFILTRNYGEEWEQVDEALAKHPNFVRKFAESDETYSVYEFNVPEETKEYVEQIAAQCDNTPAFVIYKKAIKDMSDGKENAQTEHMREIGKQVVGQIMEAFEDGQDKTVSNEFGTVHITGVTHGDGNNIQGS